MSTPDFYAVIVASGKGARLGSLTPKQFLKIGNKSVLEYSVDKVLKHPHCQGLVIVVADEYADTVQKLYGHRENVQICIGSDTRNKSVFNGLKHFSYISDDDLILIHDAVRPCVTHHEIDALLSTLVTSKAATLAVPLSGTLSKASGDTVDTYIDRDSVYALQTPQGFRHQDIIKAHEGSQNSNVTDDTQLVQNAGIDVKIVEGRATNIKITYPEDMELAGMILNSQQTIRSGSGFDVHAFDTEKVGSVRLCGIDVPHDHALKGHSDADVGLHALTDAIFGSIGEGDIGVHFPPSDISFKDMDSAVFLEKAMQMLRDKGGELCNADVTLICEVPKISPHAGAMKQRIAEICDVEAELINVKATTTEQLGFTGRKEGIAAQALVTVKI